MKKIFTFESFNKNDDYIYYGNENPKYEINDYVYVEHIQFNGEKSIIFKGNVKIVSTEYIDIEGLNEFKYLVFDANLTGRFIRERSILRKSTLEEIEEFKMKIDARKYNL